MKQVLITVLLAIVIFYSVDIYATDNQSSIELFINSDPINAAVFSKGENLGKTPLRITIFQNDKIKFRIEKSGYEPVQQEVSISSEKRKLLFYNLPPQSIQIVLYQKNQDVYVNEKKVGQTPLEINNLPVGMYQIEKEKKGISLSNKGSHYLKRTAIIETIFASGLLGLSFAGMKYYQAKDNEKIYEPLKISSFIFGGLLGYNLLKLHKINTEIKKNITNMTIIEVERFRADSARLYFTSGMEMVGKERWDEALLKFNFVVNVFPDSGYTPISIYEIGYCYHKLGNIPKAIEYFRKFVFDYPIHELFSYGLFYLLDLEIEAGNAYMALEDYNALKPLYLHDESGALYKDYFRVLVNLYKKTDESDRSILETLSEQLGFFLDSYKDSSAFPDIYLLQGKLLYSYLDREAGIQILNDVRNNYKYDSFLMKELEDTLQ